MGKSNKAAAVTEQLAETIDTPVAVEEPSPESGATPRADRNAQPFRRRGNWYQPGEVPPPRLQAEPENVEEVEEPAAETTDEPTETEPVAEVEETQTETTEEPTDDEFPSDVLERARALGLSDEEARQFGSAKALDMHLLHTDRLFAKRGAAYVEQQRQNRQRPAPPQQAAPPPQGDDGPPPLPELTDEELEDLPPAQAKLYRAQYERDQWERRQRDAQRSAWQQQQARQQQAAAEAAAREFDGWVDELGEEWADVLGKGSSFALDPNSPHAKARELLSRQMVHIWAGYQQQGYQPPKGKDLFMRALRAEHGDRITDAAARKASKNVIETINQRARQTTSRPTQRKYSDNLSPEKRALRTAENFYRDKGIKVG